MSDQKSSRVRVYELYIDSLQRVKKANDAYLDALTEYKQALWTIPSLPQEIISKLCDISLKADYEHRAAKLYSDEVKALAENIENQYIELRDANNRLNCLMSIDAYNIK